MNPMEFLKKQMDVQPISKLSRGEARLESKKVEEETEWIWVEGYKGTDANMVCRDTRFELGKRFDMPDDAVIEECKCGYHLCLDLKDVFGFYKVGEGNRFFKVRALVRKSDVEEYRSQLNIDSSDFVSIYLATINKRNKLVAKSIEFIGECTVDEILAVTGSDFQGWTDEEKKWVIEMGPYDARKKRERKNRKAELVKLGYSEKMAGYLAKDDCRYERACAIAEEPNVSADVKFMVIFLNDEYDD